MALNVRDHTGNQVGFVCGIAPFKPFDVLHNLLLAALTPMTAAEAGLNLDQILRYLSGRMGAKTVLGRIKEEKLLDKLAEQQSNAREQDFPASEQFACYLFLRYILDESAFKYQDVTGLQLDPSAASGYVLIDMHKAKIQAGDILIEEPLDYIQGETLKDSGLPIFAKNMDYPYNFMETMGMGEGLLLGANISDFGGRNHAHSTRIQLLSGNAEGVAEFPIPLFARKGSPLQLYTDGKRLNKVFTGEAVYRFG